VTILSAIGGELYQESGYVELKIPNTAIGYQDTTGSYALSLISLVPNDTTVFPKDSVPSDPSVTSNGLISRFSNVTERMNLAMPPNDAGVDPSATLLFNHSSGIGPYSRPGLVPLLPPTLTHSSPRWLNRSIYLAAHIPLQLQIMPRQPMHGMMIFWEITPTTGELDLAIGTMMKE